MIAAAVELGMGVVNAAVLGGGILATGAGSSSRYGYREAPEVLLEAIRQIERLCAEADVPLASAAMRFSARDPRIDPTIVGVSRPECIVESVDAITREIPDVHRIVSDLSADIGPR